MEKLIPKCKRVKERCDTMESVQELWKLKRAIEAVTCQVDVRYIALHTHTQTVPIMVIFHFLADTIALVFSEFSELVL